MAGKGDGKRLEKSEDGRRREGGGESVVGGMLRRSGCHFAYLDSPRRGAVVLGVGEVVGGVAVVLVPLTVCVLWLCGQRGGGGLEQRKNILETACAFAPPVHTARHTCCLHAWHYYYGLEPVLVLAGWVGCWGWVGDGECLYILLLRPSLSVVLQCSSDRVAMLLADNGCRRERRRVRLRKVTRHFLQGIGRCWWLSWACVRAKNERL